MYESLGQVILKNGEKAEACVVAGPDPEWAPRVIDLLGHKGGAWNEQNKQCLTTDIGLDVHYYLLHRDNVPFCNVLTTDLNGVGLLGHVWTIPDERRKGAASILFEKLMAHYRKRGGKALFLATEYNSHPYELYAKHGFKSIEPESGTMEWYAASRGKFDSQYLSPGQTQIQPIDWLHWPASAPLLAGGWPGIVRCAPLGIVGRALPEGPMLPLILDNFKRRDNSQPPRGMALVKPDTTAVVGLTAWSADPLWPDTCLVDVFCHPSFWTRAGELLASLQFPKGRRLLTYAEKSSTAKRDVLEAAGFKHTVVLPIRVAEDRKRSSWTDVMVYER